MTKVYLPSVSVAPSPPPEPVPVPVLTCGLNEMAEAAALLFQRAEWQRRPVLSCDKRLVAGAQWRAEDMAAHNYLGHDSSTGETPNEVCRRFGCSLPWPRDGNYIESVGGGYDTPEALFAGLLASPAHHDHMMGRGFFADHDRFGIGYAWNEVTAYGHFWVIWTGQCSA